MKKILVSALLLITSLSLQACSSIQDSNTWKETRKLYYTYINVPAEVNYDAIITMTDAENLLSTNLMRVDKQLTDFEYRLDQLTMPPSGAELNAFFGQFPWISGVALINASGEVTGAFPEDYPKELDFSALLNAREGDGSNKRTVRLSSQDFNDGRAIIAGRPAFDNEGNLIGVFNVYFDIRALLEYVQMDPAIFVMAGDTPLWLGDYSLGQTPLSGIDFIAETNSRTRGTHSNDFGTVHWINRYFYDQPLIFAVMLHK